MYPAAHAAAHPDRAAVIMASTGAVLTYAELEARSNRLAHFLRGEGLARLDHCAIFMENNDRYVECCSAGGRAGLYYTCVNSYSESPSIPDPRARSKRYASRRVRGTPGMGEEAEASRRRAGKGCPAADAAPR